MSHQPESGGVVVARRDPEEWGRFAEQFGSIADNVQHVIQGKEQEVRLALVCLIAEGHLLIEDVPGVGKTMLAKSIARSIDCSFRRIQFTPDLLPTDVTGVNVYNQERGDFEFKPGAIFANVVLGDEINRASPKTQSALLESMEEHQVTMDGVTYHLGIPFMVIATQNPIEHEGTYPLPEAQLDRFLMKILVRYPSRDELNRIVERTIQKQEEQVRPVLDRDEILEVRSVCRDVLVAPHVQELAIQLVMATQPEQAESHELAKKYIRYGSSPRGAQALVECGRVRALMRGRYHLSTEDIEAVALSVLRHRIILNFDGHAEGQTPDSILSAIVREATSLASTA
jgi:MoxR-like ATPase